MVRNFKKNAARFIALAVAVFMVLSLLPISELVFAETDNHPNAVTITVVDENGDAVTGAKVTYSVYSESTGSNVVDEADVSVDENGEIEVMSKADFDTYPADDLTLTATAEADKYEAAETGGSIDAEIISDGTAAFTINLKGKTFEDVSAVENTDATELVYNGDEITLVTVSAKSGDTVEISVDGQSEADYPKTLTADGNLTVKRTNAGDYSVNVKIKRDGYLDKEFNFEKITIAKKEITEGITFESKSLNYNGDEQEIVEFLGANSTDDIYWKIGTEDYHKEDYSYIPKKTAIGTYEVSVKIERENEIFEETVTSEINLGLLDLTGIDIRSNDLTYNGGDQALLEVKANPNNYDLSFITAETSSTDNKDNDDANWKEWNDTQFPQGKNAGNYTVWVKVSNGENYEQKQPVDDPATEEREYPFSVEIKKAKQEIFFETEIPEAIFYNENNKFTYPIVTKSVGDDSTGEITYEIITDYSETDYADKTPANATINETTGEVTYTSTGHIMVKATIASCANYKSAEKIYNIDIGYAITPEYDMTIADYVENANGEFVCNWYNGNGIEISADGWEVIKGSNAVGQTEWAETVSETNEGDYSNYIVAFRNVDNGNITDEVEIPHFAIDTTNPTEATPISVSFDSANTNPVSRVINFLTFGLFCKDEIVVTVTADDEAKTENAPNSGIKSILMTKYGVDNVQIGETESHLATKNEFTLPMNFEGTIKIEVIDNVGNTLGEQLITKENSNMSNADGYIMLENNAPVVSDLTVVKPDGVSVYNDIYSGDVTVSFNAKDIESGLYQVNLALFHGDINKYVSDYLAGNKDATVSDALVAIEDTKLTSVPVNIDEETNKTNTPIQYDFQDTFEHSYLTTTEQTDKVKPLTDGSYNYVALVVDNAGNVTGKYLRIEKDLTAPKIIGFNFTTVEIPGNKDVLPGENGLYKAVDITDYGFYFKENVTVTIAAEDKAGTNETASGVKSITYYTEDVNGEITDPITLPVDASNQISFTITKDFKGQIYAYAKDNVDNTVGEAGYVHPDGSVLETKKHHNENEKDHVVITLPDSKYTQNDGTPLYNKNVNVDISVKDEFAGIREIEWTVSSKQDTANNYSGKLTVDNDGTTITYTGDKKENDWKTDKKDYNLVTIISNTIEVSNNSNDIEVTIKMTDRAGNETSEKVKFGIDKTIPTIDVVYDNNSADEQYTDFYKADRTATVTITERNFRASDVEYKITNTDGVIPKINLNDESIWNTVENDDPDKMQHIAKIPYTADGDYTFKIDYKDNAENRAEGYNDKFTIDKTIPTVTVTYDNNSAQNGNYYKADRIATITIDEHNFDASRVKIIGTASEATFPTLSAWQNAGDKHIATLAYNADSLYTFDIEFIDMAGNSIADFGKQEFTVDKTNPVLEISGIVDNSANSGEGNIGFVISATDTNFDVFEPVITAVRYIEGKFETSKINPGAMGDIANGRQYSVANINTDGIYRITCTVVDKAGNAFSEVILQDANGGKYTENRSGNDVLLTFSVNRDGSVFYVDGYTEKLLKDFYVQNITENVQINEINTDTIVEKTITVNGKALVEGDDYTVTLDKGEGTWHRYTYSIKKSVFEKEGEYNIVIFTKDRANNQAYSDIKNVTAKFVVDRTSPTVTIAGLKSDGRYRTDKQVVTVIPSDDGGLLKKLIIRTVDEDGNVIKELINLEGDALLEAVAAGNITFELGEGLYQNVEIICEDAAGNVTGENASGELYENVSVSTNAFLIFWANKLARYLAIAGVVVVFGGVGTFAVLRKKKVF